MKCFDFSSLSYIQLVCYSYLDTFVDILCIYFEVKNECTII